MLPNELLETLLGAIERVVNANTGDSFAEKAAAIRRFADRTKRGIELDEFVAWFAE